MAALPCCVVADCVRLQWQSGRCKPHTRPRLCQLDGCARPHLAHGWCQLHYMRIRSHGTTDERPGRTIYVAATAAAKRRRRRADLDRSAAIADAVLWAEGVVSEAVLALEAAR